MNAAGWEAWLAAGLALVGAAACSGDAAGGADAAVVDAAADGPPAAPSGLVFTWRSEPTPPAAIEEGVTIEQAVFHLRDVRAIGDAAPGDPRTSVAAFDARWAESSAPPPLAFRDAPEGLYSALEFRIDRSGESSYQLEGRVTIGGISKEYRIEDEASVSVTIPFEAELAAGETDEIGIVLDLQSVIGGVDWSMAPTGEDSIELESEDPQVGALRQRLAQAFRAEPIP